MQRAKGGGTSTICVARTLRIMRPALRTATLPQTFSRIAAMVCAYSAFVQAEANIYVLPTLSMDHRIDEPFPQRCAEVAACVQQMAHP